MERILVVFYSHTGTCRLLAELLCAQLGWACAPILDARRRKGASGTMRCVLDAVTGRRPAIRYEGPDPADYEAVVLVSPVWLYRLAGPMRSFVVQYRQTLERVAVISVMGKPGPSSAAAEIERLLGRAPLLESAFTTREVDDGSCATGLQAFGQALQLAAGAGAATAGGTWTPRAA